MIQTTWNMLRCFYQILGGEKDGKYTGYHQCIAKL